MISVVPVAAGAKRVKENRSRNLTLSIPLVFLSLALHSRPSCLLSSVRFPMHTGAAAKRTESVGDDTGRTGNEDNSRHP